MKHRTIQILVWLVIAFLGMTQPSAWAANDEDDMLLILPALAAGRSGVLTANMKGATQLYSLSAAVRTSTGKTGEPNVFHYQVLGKEAAKGTTAGTGNLVQVTTGGASGLALTSSLGTVMALYTVTDPTAAYVYVALDYTNADTLEIIKQLNTGLIRVNLSTNAVEKVAPGCVAAPISSSYYSTMQTGDKPLQFDANGNVVFNGYDLNSGTISTKSSLKRVTLPGMTVTTLTDDSQSVTFFKTMDNGDIAFQATNSLDNSVQLFIWKASAGEISLTYGVLSYFLKDSYKDIIYKEYQGNTVTFARSKDGGGIDRVKLPNSTPFALVGDDGTFYGLNADPPGGTGTQANVQVSTILPYSATPSITIPVDNVIMLPWTVTPVQISKGAMYFTARIDPGDGYGNRDIINVRRLHSTNRITLLNDRRFQLYAWRQTGGYDKLYFTARDLSATSATIYSGVIDTVKLQQGLSQDQYLTLQTVASATGAAALVKDLEVLSPQAPVVNPGYEPYIADVSTSIYSEGITFSKYMSNASVESNLQFTIKDGAAISYLPVWFLSSLYLIPDLNGLGNSTTTPLDASVCYTVNMTADSIVDRWNTYLWDKNGFLPISIGSACSVAACSYLVDQSALTFEAAGSSKTLAVSASGNSCAWVSQVPSSASWLTVTASGTGSGNVTVTAAANTSTDARSATIQVAGQNVVVTQAGATPICSFTVDPLTVAAPVAGGSQSFTVTATDPSCTWSTGENLDWLAITDGASGTGSGMVVATINGNSATDARSGTIQIAEQTVTINQAGTSDAQITVTSHNSQQQTSDRIVTLVGTVVSGGIPVKTLEISNGTTTFTGNVTNGQFSIPVTLTFGTNSLTFRTFGQDANQNTVECPNNMTAPFVLTLISDQAAILVTLTWDTNNTDIDLYVIDPTGDYSCYYHKATADGGKLDYDVTQGYGPEHWTLLGTNTVRWNEPYKVRLHYYSDHTSGSTPSNYTVNVLVNEGTSSAHTYTYTGSMTVDNSSNSTPTGTGDDWRDIVTITPVQPSNGETQPTMRQGASGNMEITVPVPASALRNKGK